MPEQGPVSRAKKTPNQGPGVGSLFAVTHQGARSGRKSGRQQAARLGIYQITKPITSMCFAFVLFLSFAAVHAFQLNRTAT
jgi:hypothetical protein